MGGENDDSQEDTASETNHYNDYDDDGDNDVDDNDDDDDMIIHCISYEKYIPSSKPFEL